jgi:hypothetical protein
LHTVGLAIGVFSVATSIIAWALPLWMCSLGIALSLLASTSDRGRAALVALAIAPFVGFAALIAGSEAEVGRRDEYGDYPAAGGIALVVTACIMIAGLIALARRTRVESVDAGARSAVAVNGLTS